MNGKTDPAVAAGKIIDEIMTKVNKLASMTVKHPELQGKEGTIVCGILAAVVAAIQLLTETNPKDESEWAKKVREMVGRVFNEMSKIWDEEILPLMREQSGAKENVVSDTPR